LESFRYTSLHESGYVNNGAAVMHTLWYGVVVEARGAERPKAPKFIPLGWVLTPAKV